MNRCRTTGRWLSLAVLCCSFALTWTSRAQDLYFSADLRAREYYTDSQVVTRQGRALDVSDEDFLGSARLQVASDFSLFEQLDGRIQIRGEGLWSQEGHDDRWMAQIAQAYIGLETVAFTPVSIKAGRRNLARGHGLLFSDDDEAWLFDAVSATYDALPLSVDLTYAEVAHMSPDTSVDRLGWGEVSWEHARSICREVDFYAGMMELDGDGEPLFVGVRSRIVDSATCVVDAEWIHETGQNEMAENMSALLADLHLVLRAPEAIWKPSLGLRWTYASGNDSSSREHCFQELFHYEEWGRVFSPRLSNIQVLSGVCRVQPTEALALEIGVYAYRQADTSEVVASTGAFNNGGYLLVPSGESRELGFEWDAALVFAVGGDVTVELAGGYFWAGDAYDGVDFEGDAAEVRLELSTSF